MTSLRDQFSAVRKAQLEAQFDFFHSFTSQALEGASRVAALNLALSRDAVQRSLGAGFALANARDPRDVLALGGPAEEGFRSLFAYGRELLGIASGVRPYAVRPQALGLAPQAIETVEVIERKAADTLAEVASAVAEAAPAAAAAPAQAADTPAQQAATVTASAPAVEAHAVSAIAPASQPVVVAEPAPAPEPEAAVLAEPMPVAEPKAIVKAVGKGAARAAAAAHPASAPLDTGGEGTEIPKVDTPKLETPQVASRRKK